MVVQLPAIVAGYLNPQIPKPSDQAKLNELKDIIRALLKEQYADKMESIEPQPVLDSEDATLFKALLFAGTGCGAALLQDADGEGIPFPASDEVDRYLMMGVVHSQSFIDVIQWWKARKETLPAHCQMAMDKLGTPAT